MNEPRGSEVSRVWFFHPPQRPTGGTVYLRPDSGNQYAHIEEEESPAVEEGQS